LCYFYIIQIIFTDGDVEDMTLQELLLVMCQDPVPDWARAHCEMNAETHLVAKDMISQGPMIYVVDDEDE
jgi:hypothetical protein